MTGLVPPLEWQRVFVEPWAANSTSSAWIVLMGFFATATCGLVGNYLILRRMVLVGDAISHSVLAGIAGAFLLSGSRGSAWMFVGSLAAGIITALLIEAIHRHTRVKQDSAIGIAFTSLFALGVVLISLYGGRVDLDQECVLYGEIANVPVTVEPLPESLSRLAAHVPLLQAEFLWRGVDLVMPPDVLRMALLLMATGALIGVFYKELLVSSFDASLAVSLGIPAAVVHYGIMGILSLVAVSAFEAVGAILVIAMLILPGATAQLLSQRLPVILGLTLLHAALSAVTGLHLGTWLDCSIAGAMVVAGGGWFALAWVFNPREGLLRRVLRSAPRHDAAQPAGGIGSKEHSR